MRSGSTDLSSPTPPPQSTTPLSNDATSLDLPSPLQPGLPIQPVQQGLPMQSGLPQRPTLSSMGSLLPMPPGSVLTVSLRN